MQAKGRMTQTVDAAGMRDTNSTESHRPICPSRVLEIFQSTPKGSAVKSDFWAPREFDGLGPFPPVRENPNKVKENEMYTACHWHWRH